MDNPTKDIENAIGNSIETIEKVGNEIVMRFQDLLIDDTQIGFDIQFTNDDNAEHRLSVLPFYNYAGNLTLLT